MTRYISAIVVVMLLWSCESKQTRMEGFLLKGNLSLKEGDNERALYYYTEATKIDDCFADAWSNMGTVHHNMGEHDAAIISYTKAIECVPTYYSARLNRANTYYESGEYYSALKDLETLVKQTPDSAEVYFLQGLVFVKLAQYESSVNSFQQALDHKHPNEFECRVNIATAKVFMKKYDEAKSELQASLKIDDGQPQVYNSLALIAIGESDYAEALKQANKGLAVSPKEPYLLNNRGFAYLKLGKMSEAEKDINASIIEDPYNAWAYRNKGLLFLESKDYDNAERLLAKAKDMDPTVEDVDLYLERVKNEKVKSKK